MQVHTSSCKGSEPLLIIVGLTVILITESAYDAVHLCICFCIDANQHILVNLEVFQPGI